MDPRDYIANSIAAADARNMQYQNHIANIPAPRFAGAQKEDVIATHMQHNIERPEFREPIFRTVRFIATNKYAIECQQLSDTLTWSLSDYGNSRGSINIRTDLLDHVIAVSLDPFFVPASMISAADEAIGTIQIYLRTLNSPDFVAFDYQGAESAPYGMPHHFDCMISTPTYATNIRKITPNHPRIMFPSPARVSQQWSLSLQNPLHRFNVPPVVLNGVTQSTNPLRITVAAHGLATGDFVVFDTANISAFTPYTQTYGLTQISSSVIEIAGVDGTTITAGTSVQFTAVSRMIRLPMSFVCLDRRVDPPLSARGALTM